MKIILLLCFLGVSFSIDCLNLDSKPVDWWVILKMPTLEDKFPKGDNFYYCDSSDHCENFNEGASSIRTTDAPFLNTVSQFNSSPLKLIWNDQLFDGKVMFTHAHSKGLLAADSDGSAIIINHSLPKFPRLDANGDISVEYPNNALVYGQHIFCMSTTLKDIEAIAPSYISAEINVFQATFPEALRRTYPQLYQLSQQAYITPKSGLIEGLLQRDRIILSSTPQGVAFSTRSGQRMQIFYKEPTNQVDFYSSILGQTLKLGFVAETWGNGAGGLEDPVCTEGLKSISNVLINLPDTNGSYSYTKDHSKFAISLERNTPYVCLADFNRQITQHKRGGTAICFLNPQTWQTFDALLSQRQEC